MTDYPKAFIFDLDGVITDTAEFHYLAWKELAKEIGVFIDREFNENLKGISRLDSLERIIALDASLKNMSTVEKERLADQKNIHYMKLIKSINPENILPGIESLLKKIREHDIKIALGSASKNATMVLNQLQLNNCFDYIVDAANVSKGKPDSETFTTAADYLGIPYKTCIGVEDAVAGVEAINNATMFSVGVGDPTSLSAADYVVKNTAKLDFGEIITNYRKWNV